VSADGIGFDANDNEVRILFADGRTVALPRQAKESLAFSILETLFG
jgi:phosphopantothenoylcysteine synthetase/decarboxylase